MLERFADWPAEAQDELVQSATEIGVKYGLVYQLSDDERQAIQRSLQDVRDGRFAADEEVKAIFDKARAYRA